MNMRRLMLAAVSIALWACDPPAHPNLPPLQSGPASNTLYTPEWSDSDTSEFVDTLCQKYVSCVQLDLAACNTAASKLIALLPDPTAFQACFQKVSCDKIKKNVASVFQGCMALDQTSAKCSAGTFHYCNTAGKCVDIPCKDYCAAVSGSSTGKCSTLGSFSYCSCGATTTPVP